MVKLRTGTAINPYAFTAQKAIGGLISAATGDLAVIRTQTRPRGRHAPIEYELHLNPAALGVAAVGAGLALWLMQLRAQPYLEPELMTVVDTPEVPGVPGWDEEIRSYYLVDDPVSPYLTPTIGGGHITAV